MGNEVLALAETRDNQCTVDGLPAFTLLFRRGERPDVATMTRCIARARDAGFRVRAAEEQDRSVGRLGVTAAGLTFDFRGLAPESVGEGAQPLQPLGFDSRPDIASLEAVEMQPGDHIGAGAVLQPVIEVMTSLAANLALDLPVQAVGWSPAGTLMEPRYFCRMTLGWLAGGLFPSPGLVALVAAEAGGLASRGLSSFIGQEILLEGSRDEAAADTLHVARQVIDELVKQGGMSKPGLLSASGQTVLVEPSRYGRLLLISRRGG